MSRFTFWLLVGYLPLLLTAGGVGICVETGLPTSWVPYAVAVSGICFGVGLMCRPSRFEE